MPSGKADHEGARTRLAEYLAQNGLKQTRQREAILDAFLDQSEHITSDGLHEKVRVVHPDIGAATVYRTLKLFCAAGIAHALHFRDGVTLYERERFHHDHLICLDCGQITEFKSDLIEAQQLQIAEEHGYRLVQHRLHLYGYCRRCQKRTVRAR